ncbi:DNA polymerase III subunit beta [Paenibacillus sp. FJAT-27812]|uniref:DNA polymerase III subunit beta n=1 Tax=Paenibacillus sp. FJAT-27812 TaxID=1684143 RepID=UPI0006A781FC|nr:DNA polymerase III subunit beta [Paenibacillus sp. FJAT-27812]
MWVDVSQPSLHIGLQHIAAGLSAKAVSPILTGIKVHAGTSGLTLTASNASVTLQYLIPCCPEQLIIHQSGSVVIPARFLIDIVRSFPGDRIITLKELANPYIHIESDNSVYRLATMDSSQFPDMLSLDKSAVFNIGNAELKKMVKQVTFAASTNESKLLLTGISCEADREKLKLIATDGIRLAARTANLIIHQTTVIPNVVIPAKHLSDYSKMLPDGPSSTQITLADHMISLKTQNFSMQSLLIQGTFPSVDKLTPKQFMAELTLDTASFLHAVQRVTLLAREVPVIGLQITPNEAELFAKTAEIGDVSAKLEIPAFSGEALTVFFNGKFMKDILQAIESEQVRLRFSGKHKPIIIQPANSPDALYIITPVRTAYQP